MPDFASPLDAALYYASLGYSVLPLRPSSKRPPVVWKPFQVLPASPEQIAEWWKDNPSYNVAIICGAVSGRLVCYDVDHPAFRDWLLANCQELLAQTWVVRSGGKSIHIYVRSREDTRGTQITHFDGTHVADIKAEGGYCATEPSIHPDTGGAYTTMYGSPDKVLTVPNALLLIKRLYAAWRDSLGAATETEEGAPTIREPLSNGDAEQMAERIRRDLAHNPRAIDIVLGGPEQWTFRQPQWEIGRSELWWNGLRYLAEAGWDREDVRAWAATFPLGALTYRNTARHDHGDRLLNIEWASMVDKQNQLVEVHATLAGTNFRIDDIKALALEDLRIEMTVARFDIERVRTIILTPDELHSERKLVLAVSRALLILAVLPPELGGKNYRVFMASVYHIASENIETVPEAATGTQGFLRDQISLILQRSGGAIAAYRPEHPEHFTLGFRDGERTYLRPGSLLRQLSMTMRPPPDLTNVWITARGMGAYEHRQYYSNDARETLWVFPTPTGGK